MMTYETLTAAMRLLKAARMTLPTFEPAWATIWRAERYLYEQASRALKGEEV